MVRTDRAERPRAVGLLAGDGRLPEVLAEAVRRAGATLVCVQMSGSSALLESTADVFARMAPGEWERLITVWKAHDVREVLLAGRFDRAALPAALAGGGQAARAFFTEHTDRRDQHFLQGFAALLAGMGITVIDQRTYARDLVPGPGRLAGPPLSADEERDVALGLGVARKLADLEVGQTVILKAGAILAVEAAEGTDRAIRRGGAMAPGVVVVKVSRPQQDPRFDLPTIGPETIGAMAGAGARALAVEAGRTLVLAGETLSAEAEQAGITVTAVEAPPLPGVP